MQKQFQRLARDERGSAAIEYALIATLISLAIIGGLGQVAVSLEFLFNDNGNQIVQALGE
jgi:pilus assembly protein Flp/PilA